MIKIAAAVTNSVIDTMRVEYHPSQLVTLWSNKKIRHTSTIPTHEACIQNNEEMRAFRFWCSMPINSWKALSLRHNKNEKPNTIYCIPHTPTAFTSTSHETSFLKALADLTKIYIYFSNIYALSKSYLIILWGDFSNTL